MLATKWLLTNSSRTIILQSKKVALMSDEGVNYVRLSVVCMRNHTLCVIKITLTFHD